MSLKCFNGGMSLAAVALVMGVLALLVAIAVDFLRPANDSRCRGCHTRTAHALAYDLARWLRPWRVGPAGLLLGSQRQPRLDEVTVNRQRPKDNIGYLVGILGS